MLGLEKGILLVYLLTIGSAALCIVYGIAKWNSTD